MNRFRRFQLRTTHVAEARAFYASILGHDSAEVFELQESARARGAIPHWLGHLSVRDVDATLRAFIEVGATQLGPTVSTHDGGKLAVVRDPGGAIMGLATMPTEPPRADVVWHQLHTTNVEQAMRNYHELFDWHLGGCIDLGARGLYHQFAWQPGAPNVGSMVDVASLPGVHPQWLFYFKVAALDSALPAVRAAGGLVLGPITLPSGDRVAVCDDPWGAAFALRNAVS